MNASEYLKSQGWRGTGFSLDQSNRGLSKPLLVSHRTDQSGLGTKKNDFSEQWWATAFDKSLKSFGSGTSTTSAPLTNPTFAKHSGLYSKFVRAETLQGSFTPPPREVTSRAAMPQNEMTHTLDVKGALPKGGVRLTNGPALGEVTVDTNFNVKTEEVQPSKKRKRKENDVDTPMPYDEHSQIGHSTGDADMTNVSKESSRKARKRSPRPRYPLRSGASGASEQQGESSESHTAGTFNNAKKTKKAKKAKKDPSVGGRIRKRAERAVVARVAALHKQACEPTERHETKINGASIESPQDRGTSSAPPLHADSIMARRQKGEKIDLPGDEHDPDLLRANLIRGMEEGKKKLVKKLLKEAIPGPKSGKGKETVKARTAAKKDARRWVRVRADLHMFRPDGHPIPVSERGITEADINAEIQVQKEKSKQRRGERLAKEQTEEASQLEPRIKEQKRAKEEKASIPGMTHDQFVTWRARELGIPVEEYEMDAAFLVSEMDAARKWKQSDTKDDNVDSASDAERGGDASQSRSVNDAATVSYAVNGFVVDTAGKSSKNTARAAGKRVKDMNPAELQARFEDRKRRRAARKAARAERASANPSNQSRDKATVDRQDERINLIANNLLEKASQEAIAKGLPDWTKPETREEKDLVRENAVQEADRIIKTMRKGKKSQEEVMAEWNIGAAQKSHNSQRRKSKKKQK